MLQEFHQSLNVDRNVKQYVKKGSERQSPERKAGRFVSLWENQSFMPFIKKMNAISLFEDRCHLDLAWAVKFATSYGHRVSDPFREPSPTSLGRASSLELPD